MKLTRWYPAAALAVALALPEAHAAPQLTMAWQPSATMAPGSSRKIRVTVSNPDAVGYTNVSANFGFPTGLANVNPNPVILNGCAPFGATITAPPGGSTLSFSGLFLGAGNACAFEVAMTATVAGSYSISVGPGAFTTGTPAFSSTGTVQATLSVIGTLVENALPSGAGSLAAAITYANANCSAAATIVFQIPGAGPHTIAPSTELPPLACPDTSIDAATQPSSTLNTLSSGNDANIQVILNGSSCGSCSNGLTISADRVTVRGLAIHSWAVNGIAINGIDAVIAGNYIGTDPGGMAAFPNGVAGIAIGGSNANIGSGSTQDANLITGNGQRQVVISGNSTSIAYNQIGGNRSGAVSFISPAIGIFGASGSFASIVGNRVLGNLQYGIYMDGGTFGGIILANIVGPNSSGGIRLGGNGHTARENLVAFTTGYGMVVTDSNMTVLLNLVHENSQDGIIVDGNGQEFFDNQVYLNTGAGVFVAAGSSSLSRNLIHANGGAGIVLQGAANSALSAPVIRTVERSGGVTYIAGTINDNAGPGFPRFGVVELFANGLNPPTASGEVFVASVPVSLDALGAATFTTSVAGLPDWITATLTVDQCGDACYETSPFSFPAVPSVTVAGAALSASPPSYSYPDQAVGTVSPPTTITLANNGPGGVNISSTASNGDFSYTSDCGPFLASGATCTFVVEFRPIIGGMRSGGIFVYSDAAATTFVIPLSGNGLGGGRAAISVEPTALDFGAVTVFETASTKQRVRVSNTGLGVLEFSFGTTSEEFPVIRGSVVTSEVMPVSGDATTCTGTLAAGAFCEIVVGFNPQAPGTRGALLIFESNAEFAAPNVRLSGFGTAPGFVAPVVRPLAIEPALRFGDQVIATQSAGLVLRVANTTAGRITFAEFAISSGDFTLGAGCAMVDPGATCERSVFFRPSALGVRSARITIRSSSETVPYLVEVAGTGIPNPVPQLAVSPEGIGFGPVVGISTGVVTLTNTGQLPVLISNVAGLGGFQARSACGEVLAVGTQCLVEITFVSSVPGFREGELRVESNAQGSPHRVSLSATACRPLSGGGRLRRDPCK